MSGSTFLARPAQPDAEIKAGTILGSYKLEDLVGSGAMGRVFKARHQKLNRTVAIKVLHPEYANREDVVQRFFQEARVVNEINHEHIVEVTDFVEEKPGRAYCVMEYLQGRSLRDALGKKKKKTRLPLHACLRVMVQVCRALDAAHERGVVHRDLKPDNVFLISRNGAPDYVKVLDFGVAKLTEPLGGAKAASTVDGVIVGTPIYMAPEQASGFEVDRRTDVWAAGIILYEILAGHVPFDAPVFIELASKILKEPPPPLPEKTPRGEKIPPALVAIVTKCLKKKPDERYATMAALAEALEPLAGIRGRRVRRGGFLAPFALLALLGAAGYAAVRLGVVKEAMNRVLQSAHTAPSPQPPPAATQQPAPPPAPIVQPPAPAPSPTVRIEILSKPRGATVTRVENGETLGKTPLKLTLPRESGKRKLRFTLDGYDSEVAAVDLSKDSIEATVDLRPTPSPHKADGKGAKPTQPSKKKKKTH
jgi:tRNA A-37 threonylcarbamoyl transferase component Bud32